MIELATNEQIKGPDSTSPLGPFDWTIHINTSTGVTCTICGLGVPKTLDQWQEGSVLRYRLGRGPKFMEQAQKQAKTTLEELLKQTCVRCPGPSTDAMANLVDALQKSCVVELHLPCGPGKARFHWSWTYPWEILLTSVCDGAQLDSMPVIVRVLDGTGTTEGAIESVTVVKCNPGRVAEIYPKETLNLEEETVAENARVSTVPRNNVTLQDLADKCSQNQPPAVHFACMDIHQYQRLADETGGEDGVVLGAVKPEFASAAQIGAAVCADKSRPLVVTYDVYHSGYRTAPETVAAGAGAAIGFEGRMNDNMAENFFADFYMACAESDWKILDAFTIALWRLADLFHGSVPTGILLWINGSMPLLGEGDLKIKRRFQKLREKVADRREQPPPAASQVKEYSIRPCPELNYSLLHNGRGIFDFFSLQKTPSLGKVSGIQVLVRLQAGADAAEYSVNHEMTYRYLVLNDEIRVPLTSALLRSTRTVIYTSIFVLVKFDEQTIYEKTHRVKLLPIDQWQDDDLNRHWLPSFVWPEDPAVKTIIDGAQKYLAAISDDSSAGFGGYQGAGPCSDAVHRQASAIWWTLVNDLPLSYINPPPTFSVGAQRVRTPSDVLANRRGTCLDLALLMAACLEYIDIRPVIFLLYGHAFPGYFTSPEAHDKFWQNARPPNAGESPWMFGGFDNYLQVVEAVRDGGLVPLETLVLNSRGGYADAISEGGVNLRDPQAFQYLIDIRSARTSDVNPLPIERAL